MYYNIHDLCKAYQQGQKLKFIFFWSHQSKKKGSIDQCCFSQWFDSSFIVDDICYKTAEHWMMAEKARLFNEKEMYNNIINADSPALAKKLGRDIENFNDKTWDENKFEIVVKGNYYKFNQNSELKKYLINANNRIIAEASPIDKIWGIGLSKDDINIENPLYWKGQNLLGFAIMKVRDILILENN